MSISPQKFREVIFLLLYSASFGGAEEVIFLLMKQLSISKKVVREAKAIQEKILEKQDEIDREITSHLQAYAFDRVPGVEKNILRLAVYELSLSSLPKKVVIAEAMRLARKFATAEAVAFINAIVDGIHQDGKAVLC